MKAKHLACIGIAALTAACETSGERVLAVDATGVVGGVVALDRSGDGEIGQGDPRFANVEVVLLSRTGRGIVARATSQADGTFVFMDVPVGEYEIGVAALPDSVRVVRIDSAFVRLAADEAHLAVIVLSYPGLSIAEARGAPIGRTLFIEGVTLNASNTFTGSRVHVAGDTAGIRVLPIQSPEVGTGDSVRVRGIRGTREGQPVLHTAQIFYLRTTEPRLPRVMNTGTAASADNGRWDAMLARVLNATITDTTRLPNNERVLTVNDGSGPLEVGLDPRINFPAIAGDPFTQRLTATGVLVPRENGTWVLMPRTPGEVTISP
jgi:hypothetical protein